MAIPRNYVRGVLTLPKGLILHTCRRAPLKPPPRGNTALGDRVEGGRAANEEKSIQLLRAAAAACARPDSHGINATVWGGRL